MLTEPQKMWIDALRSGNYKQTEGQLKDLNGGYCCLGVACELAKKANIIEFYIPNNGYPPSIVQEWLNLNDEALGNLISMNDELGYDFNYIADFIERGNL